MCITVCACVHNGEREYGCTHAVMHWWGEAEDNLTFCFVSDRSPCCLMLGTQVSWGILLSTLPFHLTTGELGVTDMPYSIQVYMGSGDRNSGFHTAWPVYLLSHLPSPLGDALRIKPEINRTPTTVSRVWTIHRVCVKR